MAIDVMDHVGYACNVVLSGTGIIMQNGGVVPPALLQESRVPRFYKEAIAKCGASSSSQLPNTALVYNLMVTSRLPRTVLGNIWSMVNRTLPGQLTRQEFFSCLALIALTQKGQPLSALSTMSSLPIPHLQACAPFTQYLPSPANLHQRGNSSQTVNNLPKATPLSSSAVSLLSDINFSVPVVSNSTKCIQSSTKELYKEVHASQSQPLINSSNPIGEVDIGGNSGLEISAVDVSIKSFNLIFDPDNQIQSDDKQHREDSNLSQNFILPCAISNDAISFNGISSSLLPGSNSPKSGVPEPIKNSDVYAPMKLVSNTMSDKKEECLRVWKRCIEEAHKLFSEADLLLPSSSTAYIAEIVHTDRFERYMKALYEIYDMTVRIRSGRLSKLNECKEALAVIDRIWERLKVFSNNASSQPEVTVSEMVLCSICLSHIPANSLLEFTGSSYHRQCANLWINRIDSLLPKLKSE